MPETDCFVSGSYTGVDTRSITQILLKKFYFYFYFTSNTNTFPIDFCVQNDLWSYPIFSAIKQLNVWRMVSFWRLTPYLFKNNEKIRWRLIFRDKEPWRDVHFKCALFDLEMFLEVGNARVPKSLINYTNHSIVRFFHSMA